MRRSHIGALEIIVVGRDTKTNAHATNILIENLRKESKTSWKNSIAGYNSKWEEMRRNDKFVDINTITMRIPQCAHSIGVVASFTLDNR